MVLLHNSLPPFTMDMTGKVLFLEAASGVARHNMLVQWFQQAQERTEAVGWVVSCAFDEGGVWAGLQEILQSIVPSFQQRAPELLAKHSYELYLAAPALYQQLQTSHLSLTDIARGEEHVRNYATDRAYRSPHGIIDLLEEWYILDERRPMVIVCDQYDRASPFVQYFFSQLMRRRRQQLQLTLLLAVAPGQGIELVSQYAPEHCFGLIQLPLPADTSIPMSREQVLQAAHELEQQIEQDEIIANAATPRLISLLEQSGQGNQALRWKIRAASRFNHLGLYKASFRYCEEIDANLDLLRDDDLQTYLMAILTIYFCYVPLGYIDRALHILTEHVTDQIQAQPFLTQRYYLIAMLHARFLPRRDLARAVDYLERGLHLIAEADVPEGVRYFYTVFLNNGLAYIRVQQKRPQEAIALCSEGLALLDKHLAPDEHRLHRSVLLYNIAQVYSATRQFDAALAAFGATMKMDPYYSEYYNDRGNTYLAMGRLQEAEQDYLQAIELSPPYPEVWINLGQCYREMARVEDAISAYTRALDLNHEAALPLAARAEMYAECGHWDQALADYDASLHYEPQQPLVLAARAVAHYEIGQVEQAVADLDAAITLSPENPVFYQNRAMALSDLGRTQEAVEDLHMYLQLQPDAVDRSHMEQLLLLW